MLRDAASQAWPPFVLVAGLLLIGLVAHADGVFARAGAALDRLPGSPVALFLASGVLVVAVTAVLNLDTAVVFLTPVLVLAARRRGLDEEPFAYAAVFLANAGSLLLPGANLTNLLVIAQAPVSGGQFLRDDLAPAAAAALATLLGLLVLFRRRLAAGARAPQAVGPLRPWPTPGLGAAVLAGALVLVLPAPALPVLVLGLLAVADAVRRARIRVAEAITAAAPHVLAALFVLAVALGVLARAWDGPGSLVASAGSAETAAVAALAAVLVNNLPAAVLLSAGHVAHPQALLVGLNLGPNLAVTGALSAFLWMRTAAQIGAPVSVLAFSRRGLLLAPPAMAAALLVIAA